MVLVATAVLAAALVLLLLLAEPCSATKDDQETAAAADSPLKVKRVLTSDESILLSAADKGNAEAISRLLSTRGKSVDIDVKDPSEGHTPLILAAAKGHVEAMRVLLSKGAYIEAKSDDGQKTALLLAAYWERTEAVSYLLSKKASVNAVNDRGDSALHIAAYRGYLGISVLLLRAGGRGDARTIKHQYTPMMLAAYKGFEDVLALLLDTGLDHRSTDAAGNTAAMLAAIQGHVRCVDMLLEAARMREGEVAMEGRDSLGNTVFMLAANAGHGPLLEALMRYRPDINAVNHKGHTPLMRAAIKGHMKVVQWLLLQGADPLLKDAEGRTARGLAAAAGDTSDPGIVALLVEAEGYAGEL